MASKAKGDSWSQIGLDAAMMGAQGWLVVGLRLARIAQGGDEACREAQLMVSEKVMMGLSLGQALVTGELGDNPRTIIGGAVGEYRRAVQSNLKRLTR